MTPLYSGVRLPDDRRLLNGPCGIWITSGETHPFSIKKMATKWYQNGDMFLGSVIMKLAHINLI